MTVPRVTVNKAVAVGKTGAASTSLDQPLHRVPFSILWPARMVLWKAAQALHGDPARVHHVRRVYEIDDELRRRALVRLRNGEA